MHDPTAPMIVTTRIIAPIILYMVPISRKALYFLIKFNRAFLSGINLNQVLGHGQQPHVQEQRSINTMRLEY